MRSFRAQQQQIGEEAAIEPVRYDLPERVRNQIILLWDDALGNRVEEFYPHWNGLYELFAREFGMNDGKLGVVQKTRDFAIQRCKQLFREADTAQALYMIEATFDTARRLSLQAQAALGLRIDGAKAVEQLNRYFREARIGYQFTDGTLVRVDSEYLHAEAVVPAFRLLTDSMFAGANDEFRQAHERHAAGDYKAVLMAAENAFESVIKAICDQRGWGYDSKKVTAKPLVDKLFTQGLVPSNLNDGDTGLKAMLLGLSVVRNRLAAHGSGSTPIDVPEHIAAYCLHLAAANAVFLIEQHKAMS